ncbi:MAG: hypothetical protein MOGMAGMI_01555 [Candidatus Omnitrophica bacterium]|nr:hypothetical protein [Candidatus Omnitrophota bacterium]
MGSRSVGVIVALCLLLALPALAGQDAERMIQAKNASGSPTLPKDVVIALPGSAGKMGFYGMSRTRWYLWDHFGSAPFDNAYDHFAQQLRLGTRLENAWLKAHTAWQYGQTWLLPTGTSAGAGTGTLYFANGTGDNETHGTYLKYAEFQLKELTGAGLTAGGGRMNLSSGNNYTAGTGRGAAEGANASPSIKKIQWLKSNRVGDRLIGGFGWSEYQRSFDGGYAAWDHENAHLHLSATNPTQGGYDENAGRTLYDIDLLTLEATVKAGTLLPGTEIQFFYYDYADSRQMSATILRRDNAGRLVHAGTAHDIEIGSWGAHLAGAQTWRIGVVDYLVWGAYQEGDWLELDHEAWSLALEAGHQWTAVPWKPWLRVGYNVGSGDDDGFDAEHGTFYQMLPTTRLYSSSIMYNLMNTEDVFVSLILKPSEAWILKTEVHRIDLQDGADRWYLGAGEITDGNLAGYAARSSGGSQELGTQLDLSATYQLRASTTVTVYYAHFFGGDVVKNNFMAESDNDLFYTEIVVQF